ncbi:hypothetical protein AUJ84_01265 [Candidatus Pacearchaeota archaeon CG1_02_32_132]|nr:MAG: hypothetical protein AUJ84_01265 [Candidatus Pacearchaeota archaeon CG1_02_32_132]
MKFEVNVDKRVGIGIIASVLVLTGAVFVFALWDPAQHTVWHDANDVKITIDGTDYSLQEVLDSGEIYGSWFCTNADTKQPCIDAKFSEGLGQNGYRAVNCVNPNPTQDRVIGRAIRYKNLKWQFLTSDVSRWDDCVDGSALVVRAIGP